MFNKAYFVSNRNEEVTSNLINDFERCCIMVSERIVLNGLFYSISYDFIAPPEDPDFKVTRLWGRAKDSI